MATRTVAEPRKRHWFATLWLVLIVIVNALFAIVVLNPAFTPNQPAWMTYATALLLAVNAVGGILLLAWKKIGFWLFLGAGIINLILSLFGGNSTAIIRNVISVLVGAAIIWGVLQIYHAWDRLE